MTIGEAAWSTPLNMGSRIPLTLIIALAACGHDRTPNDTNAAPSATASTAAKSMSEADIIAKSLPAVSSSPGLACGNVTGGGHFTFSPVVTCHCSWPGNPGCSVRASDDGPTFLEPGGPTATCSVESNSPHNCGGGAPTAHGALQASCTQIQKTPALVTNEYTLSASGTRQGYTNNCAGSDFSSRLVWYFGVDLPGAASQSYTVTFYITSVGGSAAPNNRCKLVVPDVNLSFPIASSGQTFAAKLPAKGYSYSLQLDCSTNDGFLPAGAYGAGGTLTRDATMTFRVAASLNGDGGT